MNLELAIGLISLVLTILGIIIAYYFFKKSFRIKDIKYGIESIHLVKSSDEIENDITILFKNKPIKHLTISRVAIWNAGKETIRKSDIPKDRPFVIKAEEGYEFLKARIHKTINNSNNFNISFSKKTININFDFIDFQEGCTIEVYHTGKSSWSIGVDGFIIGSGNVKHAVHIPFPKRRKKALIFSLSFLVITTVPTTLLLGLQNGETLLTIFAFVSFFLYAILPMIFSIKYTISQKTCLELEVRDDDEILRSPEFPPNGKLREKDKDAEPYKYKIY